MMHSGVLLDTSFFLRFLNDEDPLFKHADGYFGYFLQKEMPLFISTISIAEYCVGGDAVELPLRNLRIVPFNFDHARRTGELARIVFSKRMEIRIQNRNIIPNDSKLFAQADREPGITYYLSSDVKSRKIFEALQSSCMVNSRFLDLHLSHQEVFGLLDL